MVRLKLKFSIKDGKEVISSQFHYGSIKTKSLRELTGSIVKSQFHYGSIKTK